MDALRDAIRKSASAYFPDSKVAQFLEHISDWGPQAPFAYFFQIRQEGELVQMEYGADIGRALVDVTIKADITASVSVRWPSVTHLLVRDTKDTTELYVFVGPQIVLRYTAALPDFRRQLLSYSSHLKKVFSDRASL
jgi:hypothetical protein